jgi:hypothetical protein
MIGTKNWWRRYLPLFYGAPTRQLGSVAIFAPGKRLRSLAESSLSNRGPADHFRLARDTPQEPRFADYKAQRTE